MTVGGLFSIVGRHGDRGHTRGNRRHDTVFIDSGVFGVQGLPGDGLDGRVRRRDDRRQLLRIVLGQGHGRRVNGDGLDRHILALLSLLVHFDVRHAGARADADHALAVISVILGDGEAHIPLKIAGGRDGGDAHPFRLAAYSPFRSAPDHHRTARFARGERKIRHIHFQRIRHIRLLVVRTGDSRRERRRNQENMIDSIHDAEIRKPNRHSPSERHRHRGPRQEPGSHRCFPPWRRASCRKHSPWGRTSGRLRHRNGRPPGR